jgi:DNA-3-methyladenine glycosylase
MHFCMNVSAGAVGLPHAVLIRALEPTEGLGVMAANRGPGAVRERDLCSGPAKLCRALAIDRTLSGVDTCTSGELFFERGRRLSDAAVGVGARIGLRPEGVWTEKPLRWVVLGNEHVSRRLRAHDSAHSP